MVIEIDTEVTSFFLMFSFCLQLTTTVSTLNNYICTFQELTV